MIEFTSRARGCPNSGIVCPLGIRDALPNGMKAKVLTELPGEKTWVIVFDSGEEAMAGLTSFANDHSVRSAHFTAIGAFLRGTLGYFDWEAKEYIKISVNEQVEVITLMGDIALDGGKPKIHAHTALAKRGGVMIGGHFLEGHVRPTLEVVLTESPKHLERRFDPASGIALLKI